MEDLTIEEVQQLVTFYKQKAADMELNLLQAQLKLNRVLSKDTVLEKKITK
jgi:hypothetical protein